MVKIQYLLEYVWESDQYRLEYACGREINLSCRLNAGDANRTQSYAEVLSGEQRDTRENYSQDIPSFLCKYTREMERIT